MGHLQPKSKKRFSGSFRDAQHGDLSTIMQIENSCFGAERYDPPTMNFYLQKSLRGPRTPLVLAFAKASAPAGKKIAGYGLGDMDTKTQGHIISMAVDDEFRGQGLGRQLLDRVCESLQKAGAEKIILEVETTNTAAVRLYETSGFVKEKIISSYYGPKRDAQRMVRPSGA